MDDGNTIAAEEIAAEGEAQGGGRAPRASVRQPRAIIDRRALTQRLADIRAATMTEAVRAARVLDVLKTAHTAGRAEIRRRFEAEGGTGARVVAEHTYLMDQLIRVLHDHVIAQATSDGKQDAKGKVALGLAIVAVGGYGRGELFPHSDVDLLLLVPPRQPPWVAKVVESILYVLWDLGLKVGHSTRSPQDCIRQAKADLTIRTSLLEARYVWGDFALFDEFRVMFRKEITSSGGAAFVEAKLAERDARHARLGDSRYVLEPNLKDGKGGLRDLHTLFWIARYLYGITDMGDLVAQGVLTPSQARTFGKARTFLWTVRCHLHYLTGRAEERLTFDLQPELARRLRYTDHAGATGVERFMKHYYLVAKAVGDLTRILLAVLEEQQKRTPILSFSSFRKKVLEGFPVVGHRVNLPADTTLDAEPVRMLSLFRVALENGLDIHPTALRRIQENLSLAVALRDDAKANAEFIRILTNPKANPEGVLRSMSECGLFGRFVPDFGRVVAQMQYDMYHVYTTDEHTIRAMGLLHRIERGELKEALPLASRVIHEISSRRALFVALFLHDIAKGRGGDHSDLGADVAIALGPRFGLEEEETETIAWLVKHHLAMSRTAFRRDLDDPETIAGFARLVQSPERLKLLLVLTCADIMAVGPGIWNGWKAALLRELFHRTAAALSGHHAADSRDARVERAKLELRQRLGEWPEEEVEAHLAKGYPSYWLTFDPETLARHARLIREAERQGKALTVQAIVDDYRAITEVVVHTQDHPGLFAAIAGGLAVSGASIVDAKIVTLADGMALDSFWVQDQDHKAFADPAKLAKLEKTIGDAVAGKLALRDMLAARRLAHMPTRAEVFTVPPRVIIDNTASKTNTLIEVNGRDRPGFLYDVTSSLTQLGLQIGAALVTTYGEKAVDVFYVRDVFGMKVTSETKIKEIRETLLAVLADPEAARPKRRRKAKGAAA